MDDALLRPRHAGTEWTFKFILTPIVPKPFQPTPPEDADMPFRLLPILAAVLAVLTALAPADACTSIRVKTTDGLVFYARTMEYATPLHAGLSVVPKGTAFVGTLPDGSSKGLKWTSKYGFVGMNSYGLPVIIDGLNEKGLVAGGLLFPGYAGYEAFDAARADRTIAQYEVVNWLLSQFATVAEVRAGLGAATVCQGPAAAAGVTVGPLPLHYTVHDATGDSLVIEYTAGQVRLYDNPLGVLTNAPPFDWMRIYLSNAVNLSAVNAPPVDLGGYRVDQTGQGSGMLGLPGDFTPPNRFLRMVALTQAAKPVTGADAGLALTMTIIGNVDIPYGTVRDKTPAGDVCDLTQWVGAADTGRGRYYFRTYANKNWHSVDVREALAQAGASMRNIVTEIPADYPDVTATAKTPGR